MKKIKQIGILLSLVTIIILGINYVFYEPTEINAFIASKIYKDGVANSAFDDENFYNCVIDAYNSKNKTSHPYTYTLSDEDLQTITSLSCSSKGIISTKGLEKMTSLTFLGLDVNKIEKIDASNNKELIFLFASNNLLTELNISGIETLEDLRVSENLLTAIDVSSNSSLTKLDVGKNKLTTIDISNNTKLTYLGAYSNQLTTVDVRKNPVLTQLSVSNNQISTIYLTGASSLTELQVYNNQLTFIDLTGMISLDTLYLNGNQLTSIDLSGVIPLTTLHAHNNQLTTIDLSGATSLRTLHAYNNQLTTIDVSNNVALEYLAVNSNQLTTLDVSKNKKIETLAINSNQLTTLKVSGASALTTLHAHYNQLAEIDISENLMLTTLRIENNQLTQLNVSKNIALEYLYADNNQLTELNLSENTLLRDLRVSNNKLNTLEIKNNLLLETLRATSNQLKELDVSENIELTELSVADNGLTALDVTKNINLTKLDIGYWCFISPTGKSGCEKGNNISSLDISKNIELTELYITSNKLNKIDASKNTKIKTLNITKNPYGGTYYVYKGINFELSDDVKIPSQLNWSNPTWSSSNTNIATVDQNRLVATLKSGNVNITGKVSSKYTITNKINVIEITSDKYQINEEENYIYVGLDNDIDTIKENINNSYEEIALNIDLDDNKLQVKHNEDILKEFKIIKLNSAEYDLTKEYIYVGTDKSYLDKINVVNGTKEVTENKLQIKYKDIVLKSYNLVSISSDDYDLTKEYIYTGTIHFDETKVNVINATREVISNKLQIKYEDVLLQSFDLVSISSETYDLSNKYILSGGNTDLDKIEVINGTAILEDNIIKIKYNEYVLQTFYESAFDDINFYKCVIDAYNIKTSDVSYDHHLTDEQLNIITRLSCNGYNKSDDDKIVSTKGLEKLLALTELEVIYHSLTQLDISNNTELTTINLSSNKLVELDISKNKKLEHLGVNSNQLSELDVSGNETLIHLGLNDNQLTELDVSENTPLKYLYVDSNQLSELDVSNNLELSWLTLESNKITKINVSKNTALNRLFVTNNQLIELDLSNNTELVDLLMYNNPYNEKLYIYKGNSIKIGNNIKLPNQLNWEKPTWLSKSNSIATVDNNGIVTAIKEGKVDIEGRLSGKYTTTSTINVIEITSDKYQINEEDNYIYVGLDNAVDTIKENINISHEEIDINVDLDNNKLQVKHNEDILKEFKIIRINSTECDLTQEYIYVSNLTNEEILSKVNIINANKEIDDSKLLIKYNNILLDEYNLVKVISNGIPILDNNKIYISNSGEDKIRISINVINAEPYIKNGKIEIVRDDAVMGSFDILSINLGNLKESSKMIVIEDEIEYNDFISNITLTEGLNYKILNGNTEVTNGNVAEGMTLKIYYGNTEVDSFDITEEYVYIDEKLDIDENNKYISNIELNAKAGDILDMIDTSGTVTITNNKNEIITGDKLIGTGTKISVKLNTKTIEYQVIIQGDIDGDGKLQLGDIMKLANYLYKDKNSLNDVYLLAADYDENGTHHLQDIMKIANKIYG